MITSQAVKTTPIMMQAGNPFRHLKPEVHEPVRQSDATAQSYQERARRTREMLRDMTVEQLLEVIEFRQDLTFFQALALAKREGKLIVPNDVHDKILMETKDKEVLRQLYHFRKLTGTLVVYEKPDKPFGKTVEFEGILFSVPEQFQGKSNCALAIEHPDFELIDLGNNKYEIRLVEGANIQLIGQFPQVNGWYTSHPQTGIPQGEDVEFSEDARRLWRKDIAYLGLLVRGVGDFSGWQEVVVADYRASYGLGVAVVRVDPLSVSSSESSVSEGDAK